MKELLGFLRSNNGALYFDKGRDCFILARNLEIKFSESTVHCSFQGRNDTDIIPENVGPEWVTPAIAAVERSGG